MLFVSGNRSRKLGGLIFLCTLSGCAQGVGVLSDAKPQGERTDFQLFFDGAPDEGTLNETSNCPPNKPDFCNGICVDVATNPAHCGACDRGCSDNQSCLQGQCTCQTGFADCNTLASDGCEADLSTDDKHCTGCNLACGANEVCNAGCECATGFFDCNSDDENGCECANGCDGTACKDDNSCNPATTNSCGVTTAYCTNAICTTCSSGTFNCDGNNANGCECSSGCNGTACKPPPQCAPNNAGDCAGESSWCDVDQCKACGGGTKDCDGVFDCECPSSKICSGTSCVIPDPCASVSCGTNAKCTDGICSCNGNNKNCDGTFSNGCECPSSQVCSGTSCVTPDPCSGVSCGANQTCTSGSCVCSGGYQNCDGTNSNGCECPSSKICSGTSCVTPDPCSGVSCGANASCSGGSCSCSSGYQNCDGSFSNGCECPSGSVCSGSSCINCATQCAGRECGPNPHSACSGDCGSCGALACNTETGQCYGCDPTAPGWCGGVTGYCPGQDLVCATCSSGYNCDGVHGCECNYGCYGSGFCKGGCVSNGCSLTTFCNTTTGYCENCPDGIVNCNYDSTCECATFFGDYCSGTTCIYPPL